MAVKSPWARERIIKNLAIVGRPNNNDSLVLLESVHLNQKLIECHLHRLLLLQLSRRTNGIDLLVSTGEFAGFEKEVMKKTSSMKMMQGALFFAASNRSLIRRAPTPTYISSNSDPEA
jgi:hypothetical protein